MPATPLPGGVAARALAKPPVRKLAKDLGVDLAALAGTGPGGAVTRDDVQAARPGRRRSSSCSRAARAPSPTADGSASGRRASRSRASAR